MWLNLLIMSSASLAVGFVIGWIVACPRRWDRFGSGPAGASHSAEAAPAERPSSGDVPALTRVSSA